MNEMDVADVMATIPEEIKAKYPRPGYLRPPVDEEIMCLQGVFVPDHNPQREYWKGFEVIEWSDGTRELRVCYWTRERGTKKWRWGQYNTIISLEKLKLLIAIIERTDDLMALGA